MPLGSIDGAISDQQASEANVKVPEEIIHKETVTRQESNKNLNRDLDPIVTKKNW